MLMGVQHPFLGIVMRMLGVLVSIRFSQIETDAVVVASIRFFCAEMLGLTAGGCDGDVKSWFWGLLCEWLLTGRGLSLH